MKLGKVVASALVASSLISAPVVAQAAPLDRTASAVEGENLGGWGLGLPLAVIIAILAIIIAISDNDENRPFSP